MSINRGCPICTSNMSSRPYADAKINVSQLDKFAFASRKTPELMHHRLVLCTRCDIIYANPAPDLVSLQQAYVEASFDTSNESHFAARTYAGVLDSFLSQLPDKEGALDVGTGDGAFLEELLKRGFSNVAGIEPSEAPIRLANNEVRPLIRKEFFRAELFHSASQSLLTCFQTLEHVPDPAGTCREAFRLLKSGGAIFVVCHNRHALINRILGKKSPIFNLEHLQLFSPASIRLLLQTSGFANIRIMGLTNRYPLRYWLRLLPLGRTARTTVLRWVERLGIAEKPVSLHVGNLAAIGFK